MTNAEAPVAVEKVRNLIRRPILFDEREERFKAPKLKSVIGVHGAHLDSVVNLARYGRFVGGDPGLKGGFYMVAHRDYKGWDETPYGEELAEFAYADAFEEAIEYSETSFAKDWEGNPDLGQLRVHHDEGVVITFSSKALTEGITFASGDEGEAELILPEAPAIDTIQAIYPVELPAAKMLKSALDRLRAQ